MVGRDGEADTDAASGRREDHRVHADDLAANVEGRAAGISAVDRRIDLDEVRVWTVPHIAADGRNNAGGYGVAEAERISDRDHPIAHAHLTIIAELDRRQRPVALDLDQGNVGRRIGADQLARRIPGHPANLTLMLFAPSTT